jgi:hypothetical protein
MPSIDVPDDPPGLLMWLQGWFTAMCDGDWEHGEGVRIETLDNPGWRVHIELAGAGMADNEFERVRIQRDEHDWVHAWVERESFEIACGPTNLSEALYTFREWVSA